MLNRELACGKLETCKLGSAPPLQRKRVTITSRLHVPSSDSLGLPGRHGSGRSVPVPRSSRSRRHPDDLGERHTPRAQADSDSGTATSIPRRDASGKGCAASQPRHAAKLNHCIGRWVGRSTRVNRKPPKRQGLRGGGLPLGLLPSRRGTSLPSRFPIELRN